MLGFFPPAPVGGRRLGWRAFYRSSGVLFSSTLPGPPGRGPLDSAWLKKSIYYCIWPGNPPSAAWRVAIPKIPPELAAPARAYHSRPSRPPGLPVGPSRPGRPPARSFPSLSPARDRAAPSPFRPGGGRPGEGAPGRPEASRGVDRAFRRRRNGSPAARRKSVCGKNFKLRIKCYIKSST
jgi:hypothetical protein